MLHLSNPEETSSPRARGSQGDATSLPWLALGILSAAAVCSLLRAGGLYAEAIVVALAMPGVAIGLAGAGAGVDVLTATGVGACGAVSTWLLTGATLWVGGVFGKSIAGWLAISVGAVWTLVIRSAVTERVRFGVSGWSPLRRRPGSPGTPRLTRKKIARSAVAVCPGACALVVGIWLLHLSYLDAGRGESPYALYWSGIVLAFGSMALLLVLHSEGLRSGIIGVALCVVTYLPAYMRAPHWPVFVDALGHYLATAHLLAGDGALVADSVVPMAGKYPGLHLAVAALVAASGQTLWGAATVFVGACRVAAACGVFAVARQIGARPKWAVLAMIAYLIGPQVPFFDSQYAYESLGVPLAIWFIWLIVRLGGAVTTRQRNICAIGALCVGLELDITHHVSSYIGIGVALGIVIATHGRAGEGRGAASPAAVIAGVAIGAGVWAIVVDAPIVSYLSPFVGGSLRFAESLPSRLADAIGFGGASPATAEGGVTRTIFHRSALPAAERYSAFAAQVLSLGLFAWACWSAYRSRLDARREAGRMRLDLRSAAPLAVFGGLYWLLLPLRLSSAGQQAVARLSGFDWIGVAIAIGVGLESASRRRRAHASGAGRVVHSVGAVALLVIMVGNTAVGANAAQRFPGSFQLESTSGRDTTREAVDLARWFERHVGPNQVVASDWSTSLVFRTFGAAREPKLNDVWPLFYKPMTSAEARRFVDLERIQVIVIDSRIAMLHSVRGYIFSMYEPGGHGVVSEAALRRVESYPWLHIIRATRHYTILQVAPRTGRRAVGGMVENLGIGGT